jgi:hypothetical protein
MIAILLFNKKAIFNKKTAAAKAVINPNAFDLQRL